MGRILAVDERNFHAIVQTGVRWVALNRELMRVACSSRSTRVPMPPSAAIGTGASGTTTPKYGTMRVNVLALECVLADGSVIRAGGPLRTSVAGLDLTSLMVGSEGTLGVITDPTMRLHPTPEQISAAVCGFPGTADAIESVIELMQTGSDVAAAGSTDCCGASAAGRVCEPGERISGQTRGTRSSSYP